MSSENTSVHGMWSSRWAFILAATGSAVGLGNIWKFPYIAGENGGGAFVLVYLLCIALIGVPILCSEIMLGRLGRKSPANTFQQLAQDMRASPNWRYVGWLGVTAGFLILTFYAVVAGWAVAYVFKAGFGDFSGQNAEVIGGIFGDLLASPSQNVLWSTLVIVITMGIVGRGVNQGLEKAVTTLMPLMFLILFIMVGYAMTTGHFGAGVSFLFYPDWSKLTAAGVLEALGHAFFTLSLASGIMLMYGAYLPKDINLVKTGVSIAIADTVVALMAGLAIFPIVFANDLVPGAGPGLVFTTLPIAFGSMPFGTILGTLFFIMLVFAAFTSAISLIESVVAWLVETKNLTRAKAATLAGIAVWVLSLGSSFSFNILQGVDFNLFNEPGGKVLTFFDAIDKLTANIMLPLCGLLIALFVGWRLEPQKLAGQLGVSVGSLGYQVFRFIIKILAPVVITIVFLNNMGLNIF